MSCRTLALLSIGCFTASSNAALFSFASDNDHTSWTFTGGGVSTRDAQDPTDPQVLLVDDHNGPLPPIPFGTEFEADFTIAYLTSVPMGGGAFTHNYSVSGTFSFLDAQGDVLLSATMASGELSVVGSALTWFSTAGIQSSDIVYTWNGAPMIAYDLLPGNSIGPDDAAFTLSFLGLDGADVPINPNTHLPDEGWTSEGSFSGTSRFIPAPGFAVMALGGLAVLRRRR